RLLGATPLARGAGSDHRGEQRGPVSLHGDRGSRDGAPALHDRARGALRHPPDVPAPADQPQPGPAAGDLRPRTRRVRPRARLGPERVTRQELKQRVHEAIERYAQAIIAVGEQIRRHPELGFKELRTAALVEAEFRRLGLVPRTGLALTGVRADVAGGAGAGPTFALLGELDALVVAGHPEADPSTGAVHACGHNAQVAGLVGAAINAVRETYRDDDTIRVHPILTHGGSQVNVIPGEARVETYVRGRTLDGIRDANAKVDRALRAGALALGATVEIETLPGYLPLRSDPTLMRVFKENADTLFGAGVCRDTGHRTGSTDMGDLSQVIPVLHPYMGGARGTGHGADYE